MRPPAPVILNAPSVLLVTSHTVGSQPLLKPLEREFVRHMLLVVAAYCGIEVVAFTIANSNFQVLIRIPKKSTADAALTDAEVLQRIQILHGPRRHAWWAGWYRHGDPRWKAKRWQCVHAMHHRSRFMKIFKQRCGVWLNDRHPEMPKGLWADRYVSYPVEDNPRAILAAAAAVEMTLVHARLVDDPAEYRWCSHARAQAGDLAARQSLMRRVPGVLGLEANATWPKVSKTWRKFLLDPYLERR